MTPTIMYHPAYGVTSTVQMQVLADDPDTQVEQTIGLMQQYAREDANAPEIKGELQQAYAAYGAFDPINAVWEYVRSHMKFVQDGTRTPMVDDMPVVEELVRPRDMHTWGIGDCDDYTVWAAALLMAGGVQVCFCTVAADGAVPNEYSHVYLVAYVDGQRVPLDFSHGDYPGWEVANKFDKRREWPVMSSAMCSTCVLMLLGVAAGGIAMRKFIEKRGAL